MADAPTGTAQLSTDTTAYDVLARYKFRPELYFIRLSTVKPTNQSHRGAAVQFPIYNDMASAVTPLSETVDVDAVAITDSLVTVTLNEYGNAALTTAKVRGTSFLEVQANVANVVGHNKGRSHDSLARNVLIAGTNVKFANGVVGVDAGPRNTLTAADRLNSTAIRIILAELRNASVPGYNRQMATNQYMALVAPNQSMDLRSETGAANWRDPHNYSKPEEIWNGEIGKYEDFVFVETERLHSAAGNPAELPAGFVDGGAASVDVFGALFCGDEALCKAWSDNEAAEMPVTRVGVVVDKLGRFKPVGWYWLGNFGIFRQESVWRLETSSSVST